MVPRVSRVLMSLALFGAITVVGPSPAAIASNATLHIEAQAQGRVGEAIAITLTLERAPRVAGYEAFAPFCLRLRAGCSAVEATAACGFLLKRMAIAEAMNTVE